MPEVARVATTGVRDTSHRHRRGEAAASNGASAKARLSASSLHPWLDYGSWRARFGGLSSFVDVKRACLRQTALETATIVTATTTSTQRMD